MKLISSLLGRFLFSLIFIISGFSHFSAPTISYAASKGVLMPEILVPFSGIMALVGAFSILLGYKAKFGAVIIILFLVPVTFTMHQFWNVTDAMQHQLEFVMFLKNLSMLGGAILIAIWGSGPYSLDEQITTIKS
ncbi:DoxX family protein [Flavobacterium tructae]|nr:DoxX family protein [Flavobacterium tructae]MDL2141691.1 DoxX family protein [Flavobacterium tructae]